MGTALSSFTGGGNTKGGGIPFKITGTTSNPVFVPDLSGAAGSMVKGITSNPAARPAQRRELSASSARKKRSKNAHEPDGKIQGVIKFAPMYTGARFNTAL